MPDLTLSRDLEPGETLRIDMRQRTIAVAGTNVRAQTTGRFFDLPPGENTIVITDGGSSRTLGVTVTHRPRWI